MMAFKDGLERMPGAHKKRTSLLSASSEKERDADKSKQDKRRGLRDDCIPEILK